MHDEEEAAAPGPETSRAPRRLAAGGVPDPHAMHDGQNNHDPYSHVVTVFVDSNDRPMRGIVAEASSNTMTIDFPVGCAPELQVHQRVVLVITKSPGHASLRIAAQVVFIGDDDDRTRIRFHVGGEARIALDTLIEARSEFRVAVQPPLVTMLYGEGMPREVLGTMDDCSNGGLTVVVSRADAEHVNTAALLRFRLALPDGEVSVVGQVRSRQFEGQLVRYGVALDTRRAVHDQTHTEHFQRFVRACQAQFLQHLAAEQREAG